MTRLPSRTEVPTVAAMHELAAQVAKVVRPGDLVILSGPLGAGKTTFAQGVGAALGVAERLTSPTFVIARAHQGRMPVVHVDAYRLGGIDELDDLDLDTEITDTLTLVEWGEGLAEQLSDAHLEIGIDRESVQGDARIVHISGRGQRWAGVIEEAPR